MSSGQAFRDHLHILDAIRAGDGEREAREMIAHLGSVLDAVKSSTQHRRGLGTVYNETSK